MVYEGEVQGVGFRYFVRRTASSLGLTGYVRNRADGRVEVEVQGHPEAVTCFMQRVLVGNGYSEIRNFTLETIPLRTAERSFEIRF